MLDASTGPGAVGLALETGFVLCEDNVTYQALQIQGERGLGVKQVGSPSG